MFAVCTKQTSCFYAVLFSSMFQEALQLGGFFLELFGFEAVTSTFYDVQTGILVEFLGTLCKKEMMASDASPSPVYSTSLYFSLMPRLSSEPNSEPAIIVQVLTIVPIMLFSSFLYSRAKIIISKQTIVQFCNFLNNY